MKSRREASGKFVKGICGQINRFDPSWLHHLKREKGSRIKGCRQKYESWRIEDCSA
jgi:hypothetical protein